MTPPISPPHSRLLSSSHTYHNAWFPGRYIGGAALVLAPILWLMGLLLRHLPTRLGYFDAAQEAGFDAMPFRAPMELASYQANPALVTAGYACFFAGAVLLWPAMVTLAQLIAVKSPRLAWWGGTLIVLGLFARAYFTGVEQTAFQLTEFNGLQPTTEAIMDTYGAISYGPWRLPVWCSVGQFFGAALLGVGAWRSGTFGVARSVMFIAAGMLWMGVLKASTPFDIALAILLALTLVPLGLRLLGDKIGQLRTTKEPSRPPRLRIW